MASNRFNEQMQAYGQWKADLVKGIQFYQKWLDTNHLGNAEDELRIFESLEMLKSDKLTIAFVAEFARGNRAHQRHLFLRIRSPAAPIGSGAHHHVSHGTLLRQHCAGVLHTTASH